MFYVSDISGLQTQYTEELFRQMRARRGVVPEVFEVPASMAVEDDGAGDGGQEAAEGGTANPYRKLDQALPEREKAIFVSQIMSSPVETLAPGDLLSRAKQMFGTKRFRHIPVLSPEEKLVGVLSDRDLLAESDLSKQIEEVMSSPVLSARPETEIRYVASVLFRERIGSMPIVDEEGALVGIVTRSDILRLVINQAPLELWA